MNKNRNILTILCFNRILVCPCRRQQKEHPAGMKASRCGDRFPHLICFRIAPAASDQAWHSIKGRSDIVFLFRRVQAPHNLFISGRRKTFQFNKKLCPYAFRSVSARWAIRHWYIREPFESRWQKGIWISGTQMSPGHFSIPDWRCAEVSLTAAIDIRIWKGVRCLRSAETDLWAYHETIFI
jgi:hypothetical protein